LDYFNNIFTNFSRPAEYNYLEAYEGLGQLSDFIKNILICQPKMKENLIGLQQLEGEQNFHFGVN